MTLLAAALLATAFLATTPSRATAQVGTTPSGSVPAGAAGSSTAPAPDSVMSMPSTPSAPAPRVRESLLETFYLFDEDGNLVPVIKAFTIEELEEFQRQKLQADEGDEPSRAFSLQELDLDVRIDPERVSATAKAKIKLHRTGWVRVPLRFDGLILDGPPQSPAERTPELEYDAAEGWIAYVQGAVDDVVELSLPLVSPETDAFERRSWRATLPSATSSTARLSIAGGPWEVESAPRAIVRDTAFIGERTEISLRLAGEAAIAWSEPAESESDFAAFEAIETSRVTVDAPTEAVCESSFLAQPLDGALKTVYVVLPERATFVPPVGPPAAGAATVTPATPEERERTLPAGAAGTLLRVEAPMATMTSFRFAIAYRLVSPTRNRIVLERPRAIRAVRQSGTVEVVASEEWNLDWTPRGSLERIDRSADDVDQPGAAAMFAYSQAPAPLEIAVEPKTSQLIVEPIVRFDVSRRETELELRLACRFQGVGELAVRLPGWTVLDAGPAELVDGERLNLSQVDPLRVPFVSEASQDAGAAEIRILAVRRRPEGEKRLELSIPRIDDAVVNPALVAVQSADDVQVLEIPGETRGLSRDVWTPSTPLEPRQQAPLVYRDYGDVIDAKIVLSTEPKSRQLSVDERTELTASEEGVTLEQRFAVQSSYGTLERFDVWVPSERLLDGAATRVLVNGRETAPVQIPDVDLASESPEIVAPTRMKRFRIDIVPPRSGLTTISILWTDEQAIEGGQTIETVRLAQPILPPDAQRTVEPAVATGVSPVRLEMDDDRWQATGDPDDATGEVDRYVAADAASLASVEFRRSLRSVAPDASPRAERIWLHTEASPTGLRHRYVVRTVHSGGALRVRLPQSAIPRSGVAAWNGTELPMAEDGTFVANLDALEAAPQSEEAEGDGQGHSEREGTLEIWYAQTRPSIWSGLNSPLPETGIESDAAPFYWSVRLPPEETVLSAPAGMRSETGWRWTGWGFSREQSLTTRDLEDWSGATEQPSPFDVRDVEVYSAFAAPATVRLGSIPRTWAYLGYGLSAFLVAGAWIYLPGVRRPWIVLAAAVGGAMLAVWAPDWVLPAAQIAVCGLALAIAAAAVDWWINGRAARSPSVRSVVTSRRSQGESSPALDEKRENSTQSLQPQRVEIGA